MSLYKLSKTVFSISHNAERFLNGITSNSLDRPRNAFLDLHGRIIAACDQIRVGPDKILIVVEEKYVQALCDHLDKYIKLSRAVVTKEDYRVYFDCEGSFKPSDGDFVIAQKKGQLVITRKNLETGVSQEEITLFRVQNNIPIQGIDYSNEMLLNVSEEEFVSYTKGCFLGQEFIAKVHSRSRPTWRLVVKAQDDCSDEEKNKMTSKVFDPEAQKIRGFVFVSNR